MRNFSFVLIFLLFFHKSSFAQKDTFPLSVGMDFCELLYKTYNLRTSYPIIPFWADLIADAGLTKNKSIKVENATKNLFNGYYIKAGLRIKILDEKVFKPGYFFFGCEGGYYIANQQLTISYPTFYGNVEKHINSGIKGMVISFPAGVALNLGKRLECLGGTQFNFISSKNAENIIEGSRYYISGFGKARFSSDNDENKMSAVLPASVNLALSIRYKIFITKAVQAEPKKE